MNKRITWLEGKCIENGLEVPAVLTNKELESIEKFVRGNVKYDHLLNNKTKLKYLSGHLLTPSNLKFSF